MMSTEDHEKQPSGRTGLILSLLAMALGAGLVALAAPVDSLLQKVVLTFALFVLLLLATCNARVWSDMP